MRRRLEKSSSHHQTASWCLVLSADSGMSPSIKTFLRRMGHRLEFASARRNKHTCTSKPCLVPCPTRPCLVVGYPSQRLQGSDDDLNPIRGCSPPGLMNWSHQCLVPCPIDFFDSGTPLLSPCDGKRLTRTRQWEGALRLSWGNSRLQALLGVLIARAIARALLGY